MFQHSKRSQQRKILHQRLHKKSHEIYAIFCWNDGWIFIYDPKRRRLSTIIGNLKLNYFYLVIIESKINIHLDGEFIFKFVLEKYLNGSLCTICNKKIYKVNFEKVDHWGVCHSILFIIKFESDQIPTFKNTILSKIQKPSRNIQRKTISN